MKNKLQLDHLSALSNGLLLLSNSMNVWLVSYSPLHGEVARQLKIKVDRKIAAGVVPKNGFTLKLTPVELMYVNDVNKWQVLKDNVVFRNAITRLITLNC